MCGKRHRYNVLPIEEHRKQISDQSKNKAWCDCCHKLFKYKQSGTNKKAGHKVRFCSMSCRVKHGDNVRLEREAIKRIGSNIRKSQKQAKALAEKIDAALILAPHQCATCGIGLNGHRGKKYCSKDCKPKQKIDKTTPAYRAHKKAWRLKRKALERGAVTAVKFNPYDIFNRDGWLCQICGIKTPESLRGTYKPNAPELDHIIPVSKGGAHHPSNCQTSCRSCNGKKSDGVPMGQKGLFTSLIAA